MTYVYVQEKNVTPSCIIIKMHWFLYSPLPHSLLLHSPPPYFNSFILSFSHYLLIHSFIYCFCLAASTHSVGSYHACGYNSIQSQLQVQVPCAFNLSPKFLPKYFIFHILIHSIFLSSALLYSTLLIFSCKLICVSYTSILSCIVTPHYTNRFYTRERLIFFFFFYRTSVFERLSVGHLVTFHDDAINYFDWFFHSRVSDKEESLWLTST